MNALARLEQSAAPLREKIISTLRGAVETGALEAGARLVERELCEQLQVSRTSLREAIRELVAEGVITQGERGGLTVAQVNVSDARSAYSLRAVIQALVVEQFIERASEAQLDRLEDATEQLKAEYRIGDVAAILNAKRRFYSELCLGAENMLAQEIIERLCLRVSGLRSRALGRKERNALSIQEIDRIVRAISERDREAARKAVSDHIESVARWALSAAPGEDRGLGALGTAGFTTLQRESQPQPA